MALHYVTIEEHYNNEDDAKEFVGRVIKEAIYNYNESYRKVAAAVETVNFHKDSVSDTLQAMKDGMPYGDGWANNLVDDIARLKAAIEIHDINKSILKYLREEGTSATLKYQDPILKNANCSILNSVTICMEKSYEDFSDHSHYNLDMKLSWVDMMDKCSRIFVRETKVADTYNALISKCLYS